MVGLSLPRLHKDIPRVVASPEGEALLLNFLTQRAHAKLPLPDLDASKPLAAVVGDMITERLNPECKRMRAFEGQIAIEAASARHHDYEGDDAFNDDDITLSYTPMPNGVFHIGPALQRIELALPGAAEAVMARLVSANEATLYPVALPCAVLDLAMSYRWCEVPPEEIRPDIREDGTEDYTIADAAVRLSYEEMHGEVDDTMVVPSTLCKELQGPFGYEAVFKPKSKVLLTEQAFVAADFTPERAADLVRRLEVEIPALVAKLKVLREKNLHFDSSYGVHASIVTLGDEATHAVDLVDEVGNDRMQSGSPEHVLRIATAPAVRRKLKKQHHFAETSKRIDGVEFFADYINLLGHMDQVLMALSQ